MTIAVSQSAQALLLTIRSEKLDSMALVLPNPITDSMNDRNFAHRAWTNLDTVFADGEVK